MKEIFLPIKDYEGYYEVSNFGNIKSVDRNRKSRHKGTFLMVQSLRPTGYMQITLNKNGKKTCFNVHRLVASAFLVNAENKPAVNHIDANRTNNILSNLEWCTAKENTQHAIKLGTFDPTIKRPHKRYRLSEIGFAEILKSPLRNKELASKFNITPQYVAYLKRLHL